MEFSDVLLTVVYVVTLFYTVFWLLTLIERKEDRRVRFRKLPKVTVLIPAYNEGRHLEASVSSLLAMDYPKSKLEIIIVDDGSTDGTADVAHSIRNLHLSRDIKVFSVPNHGKWNALNLGLQHASGEFFACLDADSFVTRDTLKNALPYFSDDNVGVVLPLLKVHNPRTFLQKIQWYEYIVNLFYKRLISSLNCVHVAPGPFSIYRTSVVKEVGGFRKAHMTEDMEIVLRMQASQYRVVQVLDAVVYTVTPENLKAVYKQRYRWYRGHFLNVLDYRRLLLNRRYGDFGLFQMPVLLLTGAIAISLLLVTVYLNFLHPLIRRFTDMFLINFDLMPFLSNLNFTINLLDFNYYKLSILAFFVIISILVIKVAHNYNSERILKHGIRSVFVFVFFYYMMLALIWASVFVNLLFRRESKW